MHSFHSAHIFIVYNSVICTKSLNILLYNGHIVLNDTAHCVKLIMEISMPNIEVIHIVIVVVKVVTAILLW